MSIQTLSALENTVEPYRRAGYVITFQSGWAINLRAPAREFSWTRFLIGLFLLWPVAVVYLIRFNQQGDRVVCVRMSSQGQIEASGFTLDLLEREQQRRSSFKSSRMMLSLLIFGVIIALLFLIYVGIINS